jgi:hypothetical protein
MNLSMLSKYQLWVIILISAFFLYAAPSVWNFQPDSGIYIGTAKEMLDRGAYEFNGFPNLLYYPGMSSLLAIPMAVFGENFHVIHIYVTAITVLSLFLMRRYFPANQYGVTGLLVPILVASSSVFSEQVRIIHSDGIFLTLLFGALLFWKRFDAAGDKRTLAACAVLVAFAPMLRFQGLYLVIALGGALLLRSFDMRKPDWRKLGRVFLISFLVLLPFLLWTARNYFLHTPDTHNMFNRFAFGLGGLELYAKGFGKVDWIDAQWKYGVYNFMYITQGLAQTVFGSNVIGLFGLQITVVLVLVLLALGAIKWFKLATNLERIYVIVCLGFIVWRSFNASSLYVVDRYWLPVLPFLFVMAGKGFGNLIRVSSRIRMDGPTIAIAIVSTSLAFGKGGLWNVYEATETARAGYRENEDVRRAIGEYVEKNIPQDAIFGTVDWGVLPFTVDRQSFLLLTDESHHASLRRIDKYNVEYLALMSGLAAASEPSFQMVEDLPEFFDELFVVGDKDRKHFGGVYAVDLDAVRRYVVEVDRAR